MNPHPETPSPIPRSWRTRPSIIALLTGSTTLLLGVGLVYQTSFGLPPAIASAVLVFLFTLGLPAVLGVACVAAVWGRVPGLEGFGLFLLCAAIVALLLQYAVCRWVTRAWALRSTRRTIP